MEMNLRVKGDPLDNIPDRHWVADLFHCHCSGPENGIELIIMGTHGYTGLKKLIMGSVASGVLNSSPVPVLLIRPEACHL
jgi:nucleotide-binding universal stress UspA family protein